MPSDVLVFNYEPLMEIHHILGAKRSHFEKCMYYDVDIIQTLSNLFYKLILG